jgi:hypothetical protein
MTTGRIGMSARKRRRGVAFVGALACVATLASGTTSAARTPVPGTIAHAGGASLTATVDALEAPGGVFKADTGTDRGYTLLQPTLIAQTPAGFGVWVDPKAPHHWAMASSASATVTDLRTLGTHVRWRGYGSPSAGEGVIRVREGSKGCGSDGNTVGMTWTYWKTLASGKRYADRADVYLCPSLFRMGTWATQATVRHELGHALGLGHTNYRFQGSYQIMNAVVRRGVVSYRSGDRRGIETLVRNTNSIKAQIPPIGKLDRSDWQSDGTIDFVGWALLEYYRADPVTVVLTDNGQVIRTSLTPVLRADVNRAHDPGTRTHGYTFSVPWAGGSHEFCITARSAVHPSASGQLGCISWHA